MQTSKDKKSPYYPTLPVPAPFPITYFVDPFCELATLYFIKISNYPPWICNNSPDVDLYDILHYTSTINYHVDTEFVKIYNKIHLINTNQNGNKMIGSQNIQIENTNPSPVYFENMEIKFQSFHGRMVNLLDPLGENWFSELLTLRTKDVSTVLIVVCR